MSTGSPVTAAAYPATRTVSARTGIPAHRCATARKAPTGRPNCSRARACCHAGSPTRPAVPSCPAAVRRTACGGGGEAEAGLDVVEVHVRQPGLGAPAAAPHLLAGDPLQGHLVPVGADGGDVALVRELQVLVDPPVGGRPPSPW
jgi:hypothetical protein